MDKIIGQNLCKLRRANGFTQEQVASYLNIKRSAYSNYELGDRVMPLDLLEKSADLFGCDLSLLLETNESVVNDMSVFPFRIDGLSPQDMAQIATFKSIVKNYIKMTRLMAGEGTEPVRYHPYD